MKKVVLSIAVVLSAAVSAYAQNAQAVQLPHTEANNSVSVDCAGLHYAYEHPIWRKGTIIGRAGMNFGGEWCGFFKARYNFWALTPSLEIEPRWYYGLDRRVDKGRSIAKNAGSFLSMRLYTCLPLGNFPKYDWRFRGASVIAPNWGLRRVWSERWMLEFHAGYSLGYSHCSEGIFYGPDLNFRFGISF